MADVKTNKHESQNQFLFETSRIGFLLIVFVFSTIIGSSTYGMKNNDSLVRNPYNLDLTQSLKDYQQQVNINADNRMVDLEKTIHGIVLDIRYANSNNFTREKIYTAPKAFARLQVAKALQKVQDSLATFKFGLKIYDAYRPYAASLRFFEVYPDTNFVANPRYGSRHNRGCAVDLTLVELATGKEIPMPTEYDDFTEKANPNYSDLPENVKSNRQLLFGIMSHFGFSHYPTEWWHFDFTGWENYKLMDLSFEELENFSK